MKSFNETLSYEITDDGYDIYKQGKLWVTQHGQYSKPYDQTKSYEENCLIQLEEITKPAPASTMSIEEMSDTITEQDAAICELYEMMTSKETN